MDIEVNVTIEWIGPTNDTIKNNTYTLMGNITATLDSNITVKASGRSESGDYTCSVSITVLSGFQYTYLKDNGATTSNQTRITTGMYVTFNPMPI